MLRQIWWWWMNTAKKYEEIDISLREKPMICFNFPIHIGFAWKLRSEPILRGGPMRPVLNSGMYIGRRWKWKMTLTHYLCLLVSVIMTFTNIPRKSYKRWSKSNNTNCCKHLYYHEIHANDRVLATNNRSVASITNWGNRRRLHEGHYLPNQGKKRKNEVQGTPHD